MLLLLSLACTPEPPGTEDAETDWIQDISVSISEAAPTALSVSFTTPQEGTGWVEFGVGGTDELATPQTDPGTAHRVAVVGVPPLSEVTMRAVVEIDGEQHVSGTFTADNGQLLPETPAFEILVDDYDTDLTFLMSIFSRPCAMVMLRTDGTVTWSLVQGVKGETYGLSVVPHDDTLLYNVFELGQTGEAWIRRTDLLGSTLDEFSTPDGHHFLTVGPSDEIVWLGTDIRDVQGVEVTGDVVMRRETDGTESVLFSHWDNFSMPQLGENKKELDWTHSNWIEWDVDRGSYLLSNAHTNTLAELDEGGGLVRVMGGPGAIDSEYIFSGGAEEAFEYPHGPHWTAEGDLALFSTAGEVSNAVRYRVDDEHRILEEVWRFGEDYGQEAMVLGEVQELPDGNMLVSWGSLGILQVVSLEGEVLWEAQSDLLEFVSQVHPMLDPYTRWR